MRALLLAFFLRAAQAACAALPYDENADAGHAVRVALKQAGSEGKQVLMIFGANWCPACRELDRSIREGITPVDDRRYVTVKIDVGRFDRNLALAQAYGNPVRKGIPAAAVVTADNRLVYSGSLADFLMPHRRLARIAAAAAGLFAAMLLAWAGIVFLRRRSALRFSA